MGDFEPEIEIEPEKAGFKRDNEFEIGDTIKPEKRERCSYLDVCSRFGHVFVGRQERASILWTLFQFLQ